MVSSDTEENKDEEEINVDDITLIHNDCLDSTVVPSGVTQKILRENKELPDKEEDKDEEVVIVNDTIIIHNDCSD